MTSGELAQFIVGRQAAILRSYLAFIQRWDEVAAGDMLEMSDLLPKHEWMYADGYNFHIRDTMECARDEAYAVLTVMIHSWAENSVVRVLRSTMAESELGGARLDRLPERKRWWLAKSGQRLSALPNYARLWAIGELANCYKHNDGRSRAADGAAGERIDYRSEVSAADIDAAADFLLAAFRAILAANPAVDLASPAPSRGFWFLSER